MDLTLLKQQLGSHRPPTRRSTSRTGLAFLPSSTISSTANAPHRAPAAPPSANFVYIRLRPHRTPVTTFSSSPAVIVSTTAVSSTSPQTRNPLFARRVDPHTNLNKPRDSPPRTTTNQNSLSSSLSLLEAPRLKHSTTHSLEINFALTSLPLESLKLRLQKSGMNARTSQPQSECGAPTLSILQGKSGS